MMSEIVKGKADMAKSKTEKDTSLAELIASEGATNQMVYLSKV